LLLLLLLLQDINQGTSQTDHIRDYYSSDGSRVAGWSVVLLTVTEKAAGHPGCYCVT
jgi:hypothetical protein